MAKKNLTLEQENQIKMLRANNEMLEKTKREAAEKGRTTSVEQIERAQQDVIEQLKSLDPSSVEETNKPVKSKKGTSLSTQTNLFSDTDMSIFDMLEEIEEDKRNEETSIMKQEEPQVPAESDYIIPSDSVAAENTMFSDTNAQYDVIQLPSNGECYRSKIDRVPVAYLTAYDENIITSPNLYRDGLVIDYLLKNKIMNKDINVEDLVSGDADAIILFLRATSYGPDFPIVVRDPDTGEQIDTTIDLTKLKPKEFKLTGDENGWFEYETPIKKDKIKFRYLTRKQEKQLQKVSELEGFGTKAMMLKSEVESLQASLIGDKILTDNEKKTINATIKILEKWADKLNEKNKSEFNKLITNSLQLQIMSVNGNGDRDYIKKYINSMPARDSLMLRRYINDNRPGIDFDIEVERPESLGGGSFKTFLNWDDSVFLNISDV